MNSKLTSFNAVSGQYVYADAQGTLVKFEDHQRVLEEKDAELIAVHRQLAGAQLDARLSWERYTAANSARQATEALLEKANAELAALRLVSK